MIDKIELKKTWDLFVGEDGFTEVRILGRFQYSGYFKSFENLCAQLEPYTNMDDEQIYFVMNEISQDCYARPQCERFVKSPKVTTNDSNILKRNFLLLDFDPVRVSQTNSSEEQFERAHKKAQEVFRFLKEKGFEDMAVAISGNGWHVLVRVDIPCDEETDKIIKDFYTYMGSVFTDEYVDFDTSVYTRARLTKLYSTLAKKGANIPSNPWRQSKIVYIPKNLIPTPLEKIKKIADLLPKEEPKPTPSRNRNYSGEQFNLETWLNEHGIQYRVKSSGGSTVYELYECPWIDTHSDRKNWDSALFVDPLGKITFNCHHSHCKGRTWQDFRTHYEPDAYDRPQWQSRQNIVYVQKQAPQPPRLKKDDFDTTEEGVVKRWKRMKDIKKVNLLDIPHFLTGFYEIDRAMKGLFEGDVTVISGLNSSGKSSMLNTLILNVIDQGILTALWSGELPEFMLKTWIQMVAAGRKNLMPTKDGDYWYVPDNVATRIDDWLDDKLLLFDNEYPPEWSLLLSDMEVLAKKGVKLFVLDNLMAMSVDIVNGSDNQKQSALVKNICTFAKKEHVHVILVAHPRKTGGFLRKNDISGTADLTNAPSNVLIVHRANNDFFKLGEEFFGAGYTQRFQGFGNVVEITKNRIMGAQDLLCGLHYEIESRRFKNEEYEDKRYGWELPPVQAELAFEEPRDITEPKRSQDFFEESNDDAPF